MKQVVCLISALGLFVSSFAQSMSIGLTTAKTSSLVFPLSIQHVDRGSPSILAEQVGEGGNILLLKAAETGFPETNVSVITSDGSLYSFAVCYDPSPKELTLYLPLQSSGSLSTYARMLLDNAPLLRLRKERWGLRATVAGIYVREEALFFQLVLENNSALDYEVDYLRFAIRDKRGGKRTAIQENELLPLHLSGNHSRVKAWGRTSFVAVLSRFTIPDQKFLAVEIGEKNGGRNFQLRVGNKPIVHATALPDLQ
jgi:hypothetical protein